MAIFKSDLRHSIRVKVLLTNTNVYVMKKTRLVHVKEGVGSFLPRLTLLISMKVFGIALQ